MQRVPRRPLSMMPLSGPRLRRLSRRTRRRSRVSNSSSSSYNSNSNRRPRRTRRTRRLSRARRNGSHTTTSLPLASRLRFRKCATPSLAGVPEMPTMPAEIISQATRHPRPRPNRLSPRIETVVKAQTALAPPRSRRASEGPWMWPRPASSAKLPMLKRPRTTHQIPTYVYLPKHG